MRIHEELRDEPRLSQDFPIILEGGDKTARVDREVFLSAGNGEINDNSLEFKTKFT